MEDIDKILGFKFTLDLSDFEKAPKVIDDTLKLIGNQAEIQGKNADLAMAGFLDNLIKEREQAVSKLQEEADKVYAKWAEMRVKAKNGLISQDEVDKVGDAWNGLIDGLDKARDELELLKEKENELAGNRSLINKIKLTAQNMDLYGNTMKLLPQPIANVVKAIGPLDAALKKLLANPVVLVIAAVVLAIKALADVAKGVYQYFDFMAERFDSFAYILGTVEGAVRKVVESFKALISADWESLEYNIKTMFDGGDREIERRHRKVEQAERDHQITLNNIENHWLRRRINNTAISYDERLKADKKFMENQVENFQLGKKKIEDNYKDWLDSVALYDAKLNPTGTKKDISLLSLDELEQYKKWQAAFAEADFQIENARAESLDRQARIREQQFNEGMAELQKRVELWQKEKQFQRQVREQMESENRRLKQLAQQTENSVLQSQINDMAEGIEKASKQAELKAKQSLEQLNNALYDEARKLYENEKAIFEGNPANEGKMFKAFDYSKYESRARKNIGYGIRESLISHEEMESIRKAVDEIVNKALEGAKKVTEEVNKSLTDLSLASGKNTPKFGDMFERYSLGINDAIKASKEFKSVTEEIGQAQKNVMNLQLQRLDIENQIAKSSDPKEKVELAKKLEETDKAINVEIEKGAALLDKQAKAEEKVKNGFAKMISSISTIASAFSSSLSALKGINEQMDKSVEALEQMMEMATNILEGDIMGAMTQVATFIAQKLVDNFARQKKMEQERLEREKEAAKTQMEIQNALTSAAYDYKLALLEAKTAQDDLYDTTNIHAMEEAQNRLMQAQQKYAEFAKEVYVQYGRMGQKTVYDMNRFVDSMVDRTKAPISGAGTREDPYRFQRKNDIIQAEFGDYLFKKNSNGEYELNTKLWESINETQKALEYFNDTEVEVINRIAEQQALIAKAQEEYAQSLADWYSPLLDDMTDAWMNWLDTGENVMDSFKDYSADTFRNILQDLLKSQIYKDVFAKYKDNISELTSQYIGDKLDIEDYASQIKEATSEVTGKLQDKRFQEIVDAWRDQLKDIGIDITGETAGRTAEARGIARASQESVDENNARLAMMQQHTYSINANVMQLTNTSAQMLLQLQGIRSNTDELRRLEHIEKSLANIETYGVTTK